MIKKPIYAISKSESQINRILSNLVGAGSSKCDISVLPPGRQLTHHNPFGGQSKVPEGALTFAFVGAFLGAFVGLVVESTSPSLVALVQMIAAGSGLGALCAWAADSQLGKLFLEKTHLRAPRVRKDVPEGNFLISIRLSNRRAEFRAKKILTEEGAEEIAIS